MRAYANLVAISEESICLFCRPVKRLGAIITIGRLEGYRNKTVKSMRNELS